VVAPLVPGRSGSAALVARVVAVTFVGDQSDASGGKLLRRAVPQPITVFLDQFVNGKPIQTQIDFESEMSEQGALPMLKPDWSLTIPRNDPVSYDANSFVTVDVQIQFKKVPNGAAQLQILRGEPSNAGPLALKFGLGSINQSIKDGDVITVPGLIGQGRLSTAVDQLDRSIAWSIVVDGAPPVQIGSSGPHRVFTTLGSPSGSTQFEGDITEGGPPQVITAERLEKAVGFAKNSTDANQAADAMFLGMSRLGVNYVLGHRPTAKMELTGILPPPTLEHYLWLCAVNQAQGECQVIAAAMRLVIRSLGVTDAMDVGFMRPHPGRLETPPSFPRRPDRLKGRLNFRATRTKATGNFALVFYDGRGQPNNFEGVVKFGNKLYALGDGIFDRFSAPANGVSADDLNTSDYFGMRTVALPRSSNLDATKGVFDLAFLNLADGSLDIQYPWNAKAANGQPVMPDAPAKKKRPGSETEKFRWED
jgi:hypothetical protein